MEKMKPEQVVAMLQKQGREVTIEQAMIMLEFLRLASRLVVESYLTQRAIKKRL